MLHSIATVSLSGDLTDKLAAIAHAGFSGVEIFEADLIASNERPGMIARMISDLGLTCTAYQPFRDFEGLSGALRQQAFDRAEHKFDLMQQLGAELMLVCSSLHPEASGDRDRIIDDFRELGERAQSRGLKIGYEALAWGRHISDHRDAWAIVRDVNHPGIGIILDTFHSLARSVPVSSLASIDPARIFLLQVADAPRLNMDPLYWSRHFRCMPGQGDLELESYLAVLRDNGFDGVLSLEIFNDRFRAWSAEQIALDGRRSLILLDSATRPAINAASRDEELPPPVTSQGVEFLEFALEEKDAAELRAVLSAMGFAKVGTHRSKAVEHWRQGDVSIVLNLERHGFAHAHYLLHGPSVCAIGLKVKDSLSALRRASQLGIESFEQNVGPGELAMPAVRGVGGSLVYLVDVDGPSPWASDFLPAGGQPQTMLDHIDHVAQSTRLEEFLSWQLYYCALFDVIRKPPVEIPDPLGLVLSQAIETPDGRLRFTLNGAQAPLTLSARFVDRYFGAGVQHIACHTHDIFEAAARMRDAGLPILEISPNYYDDLSARFGLEGEFLDKLRSLNLLYDREGDREYLQFYTRALEKGVFFEIVQRRGYAGYGAANAPVRLAAQARLRAPFVE